MFYEKSVSRICEWKNENILGIKLVYSNFVLGLQTNENIGLKNLVSVAIYQNIFIALIKANLFFKKVSDDFVETFVEI